MKQLDAPLISIIITVLNGEETISRCLKSISCQTFNNYELLVIDGGSTDGTIPLIKAQKLLNITITRIPGLGLYAGLNRGVDAARGQWLYFMGCDDEFYQPDTLQLIADLLAKQTSATKLIAGRVQYAKQGYIMIPQLGSPYWVRFILHHQGIFYHRSAFQSLRYNESLAISADYELNLRLALAKVPYISTELIVAKYGEEGISSTQIEQGFAEMQKVHKLIFKGVLQRRVLVYSWLHHKIWLLRYRLNLLNVKVRVGDLFGFNTLPSQQEDTVSH